MKQHNRKILEAIIKGIQLALDDYEDKDLNEPLSSKHDIIRNDETISLLINNFVDLGLPSGTLWCKYNLGVDPNKLDNYQYWYGDYYQWGETTPSFNPLIDLEISKKNFHVTKKKYGYDYDTGENGFDELQVEDDPVTLHYKSIKYHTPTVEQLRELKNNTVKKFVNNYKNIKGLNGLLLTGKNGNEIFFPMNGFIDFGHAEYFGEEVCFWSKNIDKSLQCPYCFSYYNTKSIFDYISIDIMVLTHATAIRPVYNF